MISTIHLYYFSSDFRVFRGLDIVDHVLDEAHDGVGEEHQGDTEQGECKDFFALVQEFLVGAGEEHHAAADDEGDGGHGGEKGEHPIGQFVADGDDGGILHLSVDFEEA